MKRPDDKVIKALALATRQFPEILEWLGDWRAHELDSLPYATNTPTLSQGRCQVLCELYKFAKEAPDHVKAKSL